MQLESISTRTNKTRHDSNQQPEETGRENARGGGRPLPRGLRGFKEQNRELPAICTGLCPSSITVVCVGPREMPVLFVALSRLPGVSRDARPLWSTFMLQTTMRALGPTCLFKTFVTRDGPEQATTEDFEGKGTTTNRRRPSTDLYSCSSVKKTQPTRERARNVSITTVTRCTYSIRTKYGDVCGGFRTLPRRRD